MLTAIHNHFNVRKLCDVDIPDDVLALLDKPPALQDPFKAEDHVVTVKTPHGDLKLFKVMANGVPYIVTAMPEIALANAA